MSSTPAQLPKTEIHHGLTFAEYQALPGWNWSKIKLLEDGSPRHVKHALTAPDEDTSSRVMLRAVHALVLEPDRFEDSFSVYGGRRDKRTKAYQAHLEEHAGTAVLNVRDYDLACTTARAIRTHPGVRPLLDTGRPEVSLTWVDEATGLPCKCRIDWLGSALVDLKTLGTTNERQVASIVARDLNHGQLAHYDAGLRAHDINVPAFLVVAEGKGAHDVAVFELDAGIPDGALHVGRVLRRRLMTRLAECVEFDHWPGRHEGRQQLCLPTYALLDESSEITFGED